ncbi:hypothetical protein MPSEU_000240900 [Mayamaea pseudoterrestris]|nr:hypothetical protein MPSEU_000240900 [Mayamaea pseudoterrestris]
MAPLILSGTADELKSPRALKILAACCRAGLPVTRTKDSIATNGSCTPPSSDGLKLSALSQSSASTIVLTTSRSSLLYIASLAPLTGLGGATAADQAMVDAWLSYGWSSIDVSLAASGTPDLASLQILDQHLLHSTYLVGDAITVADIGLVASLYLHELPSDFESLNRWVKTIVHQEFFQSSLQQLQQGTTVAAASRTSATAHISTVTDAVAMNGAPTAVVSNLYRRHRIRIKEILQAATGGDGTTRYETQLVTVAGWARTIRKASSKLVFVELNDGSTNTCLQCVLDFEKTEGFEDCKNSGGTGASFQFVGTIVPSKGGEQAVDLQVSKATLLGAVYGGDVHGTTVGGMLYPMAKKEHTLEHLREQAHLRPRASIHAAAMRIRHAMAFATHNFFHNHGFLYIHTPILTGADCEGAGEQFGVTTLMGTDHLKPGVTLPIVEEKEISKSELKRLEKQRAKADPTKPLEEHVPGAIDYSKDFFGQRVNLTVSGQLNVETHACALSDVYTFGPTFRAEESRTYRHLAEFWMIEPEICFADLNDDMNLAEDYLKYCVQFALENCSEDLEFFENNPHGEAGLRDRLRNVLDNEFKRLTYTEAIELLQKAAADGVQFEVKPEWGIDLPSEHERYICETIFKKPVILTNYPKEIKAFYMKVDEDGRTVAAADVLVPKIGEIIGGSQREHRLDVLKQRCIDMNLDPRAVWWYLDLRRYGTVPHAGFGLGFERLILFVTGLDNIRDVVPFPRWVGNSKF